MRRRRRLYILCDIDDDTSAVVAVKQLLRGSTLPPTSRDASGISDATVNIGVAASMAYFPNSGWKDSSLSVMHGQGRDAVGFYTEKKVVIERWPKQWSRTF